MQAHAHLAQATAAAADARAAVAAWAAAALAKPAVERLAAARPAPPPPPSPPPRSLSHNDESGNSDDAAATADALRTKGNAAFTAGDWAGAAALYAASLAACPTAPAAANHSAAALRCGDALAALASADAALVLRPAWAKAHARRGEALTALGDDVGAFLAWDEAARCEPGETGWAKGRRAALEAAAAVRGWRVPGVEEEEAGAGVVVVEEVVDGE